MPVWECDPEFWSGYISCAFKPIPDLCQIQARKSIDVALCSKEFGSFKDSVQPVSPFLSTLCDICGTELKQK